MNEALPLMLYDDGSIFPLVITHDPSHKPVAYLFISPMHTHARAHTQTSVCHDPQHIICREQSLIRGLNETPSAEPHTKQDLESKYLNVNQGLVAWLSRLNVGSKLGKPWPCSGT